MRRLLPALLLLAAGPAAAQVYAVPTAFCGGSLMAMQFETVVTPGPQGRADYRVTLRNVVNSPMRFAVQVQGDVLGKPSGLQSLAGGQMTVLNLGYMLNAPGRMPMRNEQLANAVRISCQAG